MHEQTAYAEIDRWREKLDELAQFLYEEQTITGDEFMEILNS